MRVGGAVGGVQVCSGVARHFPDLLASHTPDGTEEDGDGEGLQVGVEDTGGLLHIV